MSVQAEVEAQEHGVVTLPVYFLHSQLGIAKTDKQQISGYSVIKEMNDVISEECIDGIQRIGGLWRVHINSNDERIKLLSQGFSYKGISVSVRSDNPFHDRTDKRDAPKGTRVLIMNVPLTVPNSEVENMMKMFCVPLISGISYECELDDNRQLTRIKNGNRSVYVDTKELKANPIPRFSFCGNWRCRLSYRGQPVVRKVCFNCNKEGHLSRECRETRACAVCHEDSHREGDESCPAYAPSDSEVFRGEEDVLSNFYPCDLVWNGQHYASAEHIYQAEKARMNGRPEVAVEIQNCERAVDAKKLGKKVYAVQKWEEENEQLMLNILRAKLNQLQDLSDYLRGTKSLIAEAVPFDFYWSCGLSKKAAENTDPQKWPGKNVLGNMWMTLKQELIEAAPKRIDKRKDRGSDSQDENENPTSRLRKSGTTPVKNDDSQIIEH